ncbi:unnamed protein product [Bubo scandiacus]
MYLFLFAWAVLAAVTSVALQFSEQFIKLECVRFFLFSQLWLFADDLAMNTND